MDILKTDKILIVAPHPDDEVIGCGGVIAKYKDQIDVLCINSSGVKYEWDKLSAEEIAQLRCDEFKNVMQKAGVKNFWITKFWGEPPMIDKIEANFDNYIKQVDFKKYDIIFIPHINDGHIEHRYVGNKLISNILRKTGYKENLKIFRYEIWTPMHKVNHYEDITDFVKEKEDLINTYISRIKPQYATRILGLNKYRTLSGFFCNPEKYAEAYWAETVEKYLSFNK